MPAPSRATRSVNPSLLKSLNRVTAATVAGVTALDTTENGPVPTAFVARTWNVYAVPLVSPVTVRLVAPAAAGRRAPTGRPVSTLTTCPEYPVTGDPPSSGGGAHLTTADELAAVVRWA